MSYIQIKDPSRREDIKLYYEDLGEGQPVVFIHGWPLCGSMWEYQITELVKHNIRCITYDRRGFGNSSKPLQGYDYDTLTDDLKELVEQLDLQDVILIGFSMGGGEVARYFSRYKGERIAKAALISAVTPYLLKTDDNPDGVDENVFTEIILNLQQDRIGFLDTFGKQFFGINILSHPVSTAMLDHYRTLGAFASPIATQECVKSFAMTDFRNDLPAIHVPVLIIHGDSDKIVPVESSSERSAKLIADNKYLVYDKAPHGLFYTHKEQLNRHLLSFISGMVVEEPEEPTSVVLPSNYPI